MRRASEIVGLPVLCERTLRRIGSVEGIAYSAGRGSIDGLHIRRAGMAMKKAFIPLEDISLFGDVSILVRDGAGTAKKQAIKKPAFSPPVRARSVGGEELGLMRDFLFDPRSGKVEALEISRGFLDDMFSGRLLAWRFAPMEIADEIIVLPDKRATQDEYREGGESDSD